jgi:hypothetical protein
MNQLEKLAAAVALAASAQQLAQGAPQPCAVSSPAHRVALLELYTSEGCSSCPPADHYLAQLAASQRLVPLSLHVDYWNYIGWQDPFSRPAFSARQRWLTELGHSRTVYTPALFVGGREQRGGPGSGWLGRSWDSTVPAAVARINAEPAQAEIHLELGAIEGGALPLEIQVSARQGGQLHIALTEGGLASQVTAGENSGRLLRHEHVVREWLPAVAVGSAPQRLTQRLTVPQGALHGKLGVVAFVQSATGEVVQAVALKVCER